MKHRTIIASVFVCLVLFATLAVPNASAASQIKYTTTSDFDGQSKEEAGANYFAINGVDQPSNFIVYPNSYFFNGRTYTAWQCEENYSMCVNVYTHSTNTWGTQKRVVNGATENPVTGDGHGSPGLIVDSSGYVHLFCCAHDTAIQHYRTNSPEDISAWTEKSELTGALTYPHPVIVGSSIYVIYRSVGLPNGPWSYRKSTDGGETWGANTDFLDWATGCVSYCGTAYIGGTDVYADQIHMFAVAHRNTDGERYSAFEFWINTTDGNVYCEPTPTNFGAVLTKTEADTNDTCEIMDTFTILNLNTNFGSVDVDSSGNPRVIWRLQQGAGGAMSETSYRWVYSAHGGVSWSAVEITWTDNFQNYGDLLVYPSGDIDAFLITNSTGVAALYEGGDLQRWRYNGVSWSLAEVIHREVSSGKPLEAPIVPVNAHNDFKIYFNQRHFDDATGGPANARIYGWGDRGFLFNPAFSFGPKGTQTNTDCKDIASGEFQLASTRCDDFSIADSDGVTFNWGNATAPQYGSGATQHAWATSARTIANGQLNITYDATGSIGRWGVVSTAQITGNWDISIRTYLSDGCTPTFGCGMYLNVFNEQVLDGFAPASVTVDGVFYYRKVSTSLQTYTLTNGVETFVGTSDFPANPLLWLRIAKSGTTITWYYRTSDSAGWTTDQTATFATDTNMFVSIVLWNSDTDSVQYGFDNYNTATSSSVIAPGYRPRGSWSTNTQTFNGEIVKSVIVNYTGVSASRYIDEIAIIASSGETLAVDSTDRVSGTSATFTIPDSALLSLHGYDWRVRIKLVGDGVGSPSVNEVVINTVRSSITIATSDGPWIFGFFALLTLGMLGALAIKRKRGGR